MAAVAKNMMKMVQSAQTVVSAEQQRCHLNPSEVRIFRITLLKLSVSPPQRHDNLKLNFLFFHCNHLKLMLISRVTSSECNSEARSSSLENISSSHVAVSPGWSRKERASGKRNKTWDIWEVEGIFKWWDQMRASWWWRIDTWGRGFGWEKVN